MDCFDLSANYTKPTNSFDAKKAYNPHGGSEYDDRFSTTNSTCGSSVNGGIKHRKMKNFGNVKSFRKRAKSRIIHQSPFTISDEGSLVDSSESSPHYLKSTSSSQGKKMKSLSNNNKSFRTLSRTSSSLRNVRILIKKTSFKPRTNLSNSSKVSDDVAVTRGTFSSTLKGSKFLPQSVEVRPRGAKSEKSSGDVKVCRYHHCSLHGHCRGADDPDSQTKRLLYKRRRSMKKQKIVIPKTEPGPGGEKRNSDEKKNIHKTQIIIPPEEQLYSYEEISRKPVEEQFGDGYESFQESDFIEVVFGETSFPERSYKENLDMLEKYSLFEQELSSGYCLRCSSHNKNNDDNPRYAFTDVIKKPNEQVSTLSRSDGESNKDSPDTPIIYEKSTKKNIELSSASAYNQTSSDDTKSDEVQDFTTESTPAGNLKVNNKITENNDSPTQEVGKLQFSKPRHVSMWNLIHQHMSANVAVGPTIEPLEGTTNGGSSADSENSLLARRSTSSWGDLSDSDMGTMSSDAEESREIEVSKMFAIKLVREAIEKILLPEVQDQTSDDQSVTSESSPRIEIVERNQTEDNTEEKLADKDEGTMSTNPKQSSLINDNTSSQEETKQRKEEVATKPEKKAPLKHWSNLKKWILLQRFIRQLEKVKKFNPKKPQHLPVNPDNEAEKVSLRSQTVGARKNAEEWMLDYAIRQAVGQLAPTQKRKVALLVKAFETVAPIKGDDDPQVQCRNPRLKPEESVCKGGREKNGTEGGEMSKKTEKLYHSNDNRVPSNGNAKLEDPDSVKGEPFLTDAVKLEKITTDGTAKGAKPMPEEIQESATYNPVKGCTEESGPCIQRDNEDHIRMWHMIYHHVVSGIAEKVGSRLLDGPEDDEVEDKISPDDGYSVDLSKSTDGSTEKNHVPNGFTKSDALKLVKEAVDEILLPEIQDDSSDTQSFTSEVSISDQDISEINCNGSEERSESRFGKKSEVSKSKNWSKLKKLILLKRSITALEKGRKVEPQPNRLFSQATDCEPEKVDLRSQMTDERKKAEQWMVDYAVRHIVTKLTPARKRRVSMLVEAFEAVVPLPVI